MYRPLVHPEWLEVDMRLKINETYSQDFDWLCFESESGDSEKLPTTISAVYSVSLHENEVNTEESVIEK